MGGGAVEGTRLARSLSRPSLSPTAHDGMAANPAGTSPLPNRCQGLAQLGEPRWERGKHEGSQTHDWPQ